MRRIVMFNRVSADGLFTGPKGELDWVVPEPEFDRSVGGGLSGRGTILFGRRTYDMFESFWPHALDDRAADRNPHGRPSAEMRPMAVWINEADKIVFSKTRKEVTWRNSRLLRDLDPRAIESMKKESGPDIMIFGSGSIVAQLTDHGLIDEYQLLVSPIVLGSGRRLFDQVSKMRRLELLEAKSFPQGNAMLRYAVSR